MVFPGTLSEYRQSRRCDNASVSAFDQKAACDQIRHDAADHAGMQSQFRAYFLEFCGLRVESDQRKHLKDAADPVIGHRRSRRSLSALATGAGTWAEKSAPSRAHSLMRVEEM